MDLKSLFVGCGLFIAAHILTWFQLNGQFLSNWFKENTWAVALFGIPISYLFIYGTRFVYDTFGGLIWPGRFIGFSQLG